MKVIFAQGNPGPAYAFTRHNVGFMAVDALASEWGVTFSEKSKFQALVAETTQNGEKVLLVKPLTFYNESGYAARRLIDFYKLNPATDFLVIHDELALPFGTIKTRGAGRDAGNNGIKSLNNHIGEQYNRIRIGIFNPLREQMDDADFVLSKFSADEQAALPAVLSHAHKIIADFLHNTFEITKTTLNNEKGPPKDGP